MAHAQHCGEKRRRYSPGYVVEGASEQKQPLVDRFVVLPARAVQEEEALGVKRRPEHEERYHNGSWLACGGGGGERTREATIKIVSISGQITEAFVGPSCGDLPA